MIRDRNIQWARQRMYIPVWQFQGWINNGDGQTFDSAAISTPPILSELAALGIMGLQIADEDEIRHTMEFPSVWDITREIGVRVIWTYDATATVADNVTWLFLYDQVDVGEAIAAPATALNTAITNQTATATTLLTLMRSPRGIINANTFDSSALDGLFTFKIEASVVDTFSADEPHLLGVSFDYYPRWTVGGPNATVTSRQ